MAVRKNKAPSSRGTKIDFMKEVNDIGQPLAAVAGFAVGKYALKKLTKSQTVSGLLGTEMKDYIVPAAVTPAFAQGKIPESRYHPVEAAF